MSVSNIRYLKTKTLKVIQRRVIDRASGLCVAEGPLVFGEREGSWTLRYRNGQIRATGDYFQGEEQGFWNYWHKNEQSAAYGEYVSGDEHGPWVYYYDNKVIRAKGHYAFGAMEGKWVYRNPDGSIERIEIWLKGEIQRRLSLFPKPSLKKKKA